MVYVGLAIVVYDCCSSVLSDYLGNMGLDCMGLDGAGLDRVVLGGWAGGSAALSCSYWIKSLDWVLMVSGRQKLMTMLRAAKMQKTTMTGKPA